MSSIQRPSQYKQSSRKGKKSWRKNIDLTDIETKLEQRLDQEIHHGTSDLKDLKNEDLFQVDTLGDDILKQKLIKRKQIKNRLKSKEILNSIQTNSKVKALTHPKNDKDLKNMKKVQGISKKEITRLMALAGRIHGENKSKVQIATNGLTRSKNLDLWGSDKPLNIKIPSGIKLMVKTCENIPKELLTQSTTGWSVATVAPNTISRKPLQVKDVESVPHAGKSFNPDKKDWENLIEREYNLEEVKERRRIQIENYKSKIEHLMDILEDQEEEESENSAEESGEETNDNYKLSINPSVKNKKKTKYQRNKQNAHKRRIQLQNDLTKLKSQLHELENLETIKQEVSVNLNTSQPHNDGVKERKNKHHKLGTKHSVIESPLEVKFTDELSDSLRKLRPEGNLLYETVMKLQSNGKIEARIPIRKGRRYKQKITEKWTYKDLK